MAWQKMKMQVHDGLLSHCFICIEKVKAGGSTQLTVVGRQLLANSKEITTEVGRGVKHALVMHFARNERMPRRFLSKRKKANELLRLTQYGC